MRRLFSVLFAASLALAGCSPEADEAPSDFPEASPALWEVSSPEGKQAWLFGTVHALPDGLEWRTAAVDHAFDQSGVLVVEIADLDDTQTSFNEFRSRAYTPGMPDLLDRFQGPEREQVEALVERTGGDADDYSDMESWAAAIVLASGIRSGDPQNGVDRALIARGRPVEALESYAGQFTIFDTLPADAQDDFLLGVAQEAGQDSGDAIMRAWLTGDVERLDELSNASLLQYPVLRQRLLVDRNTAWVDKITAMIESERRPFVATGAGHMVGTEGLPALLAARGYTVQRIQ